VHKADAGCAATPRGLWKRKKPGELHSQRRSKTRCWINVSISTLLPTRTEHMMKTEKSAGRAYLVLWKYSEAERINGSVITRGEGSHSGGLKKGDRIFVWATKGDELYILGAIQIERGGREWAEGQSLYGPFQIVPLKGLKWRLRFQNSASEKLSRETPIALQVRARRQPTPETIGLLEKLLSENAGRRANQARRGETERQAVTLSKAKRKQTVEKPFSIDQVEFALVAVKPKITDAQMSMLRAHYLYRVLSMERIAEFAGYTYYGSANLQYGALCGRIARELGYSSPGSQTYTIANVAPNRDKTGAFQWQMDDVVVKALKRVGWFSQVVKELAESSEPVRIAETERDALVQARIGQGKFRTDVIALWGCCAVTGCSMSGVLVASHIVPWAQCATNEERLDPLNGLLLTPNLDKLFDQFLISFKNDGAILLSKELRAEERAALGIAEQRGLQFVPPAMRPYLKRHRDLFSKKQKIRNATAR